MITAFHLSMKCGKLGCVLLCLAFTIQAQRLDDVRELIKVRKYSAAVDALNDLDPAASSPRAVSVEWLHLGAGYRSLRMTPESVKVETLLKHLCAHAFAFRRSRVLQKQIPHSLWPTCGLAMR